MIRRRKSGQASLYWKLGKLLNDFISRTEEEFIFTNYRVAFQRDLGITDSYVGVIVDFPKFFDESEVLPNVAMSHYFELLLKARRLSDEGSGTMSRNGLWNLQRMNPYRSIRNSGRC